MRSAEELNVDHSMVAQNLKQTGKVKKLDEWVLHELTAGQGNHHFEVFVIFSYSTQQQ